VNERPDWVTKMAQNHEKSKKSWNPWLHRVASALKGFPWITDVSCPSISALREKIPNAENHFATTGDGLLGMLFEVLSYEGDGRIRYVNLWEITEEQYPGEKKRYKWKPGDAYPSIAANYIHKQGVRHGDEMTFPELIEHIETMVEARRQKYA